MKRRLLWSALILVLASLLFAADRPAPKKAWEWTDEERIAALNNVAARGERLRAARDGQERATVPGAPPAYDVIDGARDPHLYLEWEVFESLSRRAYSNDPLFTEVYRDSIEEKRRDLGLPDDLWPRLEAISTPYLASLRGEAELGKSGLPLAEINERQKILNANRCRDRYEALSEAKRVFGPKFAQFLYTAVAPGSSSTIWRKGDPETLLWISRGCQ